jgi:flagellar motility protein MotE (MotC chaperone)
MFKTLLSLLLVLVGISNMAYAQEVKPAETKVEDKVYPTPANATFKIQKKDFSENEVMILQSLEAKRVELERKAQVLMVREKLIDLSEIKLQDKITKLETLERSIKDLLGEVSKKEEKRLSDLAIVYSEMKPALAAERLNILDEITVYGILKRMNFKKSAKILEKMNIQKVKVISRMLAEKTLLPVVSQ